MSRSHVAKAVGCTHTPSNVVPLGHCTAGVAAKHNRSSVTLPPGILESGGHWNSSIWVPLAPGGPCGPCGPGGPCGPVLLSSLSLSFLSSLSNLIFLQNSTEDTKKPSKGPVLHSYFLSSVGYWL